MYVINNMEFFVKISHVGENEDILKVDYVDKDEATRYETISEAAAEAESMCISGFEIKKV